VAPLVWVPVSSTATFASTVVTSLGSMTRATATGSCSGGVSKPNTRR
jgi:hypothetical protein